MGTEGNEGEILEFRATPWGGPAGRALGQQERQAQQITIAVATETETEDDEDDDEDGRE